MRPIPTFKSRLAAYLGIFLIVAVYILEGWINWDIKSVLVPPMIAGAIGFLFLSRSIREKTNKITVIPNNVKKSINRLISIEVFFSLLSGISTTIALLSYNFELSSDTHKFIFIISIGIFALNAIANFWINRKYNILLNEHLEKRAV